MLRRAAGPIRAVADAAAGPAPAEGSSGAGKAAASDAAPLAVADGSADPITSMGPTGFPAHLLESGETAMPDFISVWGFTLVSVMAFCWVSIAYILGSTLGCWRGWPDRFSPCLSALPSPLRPCSASSPPRAWPSACWRPRPQRNQW